MELTHELRENAGLQWVLERLSPLSPFGKQAARTPRWYGPGEEAALVEELDNVALAMELWAAGGTAPQAAEGCGCEAPRVNPADLKDAAAALRGVTRCLPLFHDIPGSPVPPSTWWSSSRSSTSWSPWSRSPTPTPKCRRWRA